MQSVTGQAINSEGFKDKRVTRDEITLAVISHALSFVEGGIIGPLIIYLIKRNDSQFIAFHALQSLYFGLLFVGVFVVSIITCIGPIVCAIAYLVFEIIACIRASEGRWYRLPLAGDWAMRSHPIPLAAPEAGPFPQPPQAPRAGGYAGGSGT